MFQNNRVLKAAVVAGIIAILMLAAYAFAATNVVPPTNVGFGNQAVSNFTVTGVIYTMNATNPANLDYWTLTLGTAANEVRSSVNGGTSWTACTSGGNAVLTAPVVGPWVCNPNPDIAMTAATDLQVAAVANDQP